jgi:hypothetical protein
MKWGRVSARPPWARPVRRRRATRRAILDSRSRGRVWQACTRKNMIVRCASYIRGVLPRSDVPRSRGRYCVGSMEQKPAVSVLFAGTRTRSSSWFPFWPSRFSHAGSMTSWNSRMRCSAAGASASAHVLLREDEPHHASRQRRVRTRRSNDTPGDSSRQRPPARPCSLPARSIWQSFASPAPSAREDSVAPARVSHGNGRYGPHNYPTRRS